MKQAQLPITLSIITLNEESNIARCIQSVPWAQQVIVLDSGSSDRTCDIARELGAQVFVEKWQGFGKMKQRAADLAPSNWVLSLDADEALSPELSLEIQSLFTQEKYNEAKPHAYRVPRKSYFLGRWINYGGWYPDYQMKLFNRTETRWTTDQVHEKLNTRSFHTLKHPILHWVFKDISHQITANNKYSGLGTEKLISDGKQFSLFKLLTKPPVKFIECYFIKLGFLDGMPGFIIAMNAAHSMFLKFAKLWEIERQK